MNIIVHIYCRGCAIGFCLGFVCGVYRVLIKSMCKTWVLARAMASCFAVEKCVNQYDLWHMGMADISKENRKINYMTFTNPSHEEDEIRELQLETLINMFRIILSSL